MIETLHAQVQQAFRLIAADVGGLTSLAIYEVSSGPVTIQNLDFVVAAVKIKCSVNETGRDRRACICARIAAPVVGPFFV